MPKHTNVFKIGNPLQANILSMADPAFNLNYSVTATQNISSYYWEFGDGNNATTPLNYINHTFNSSPEQYYTTKLILSNGTNTCVSYYQTSAFNNTAIVNSNFTSSFTPIPNLKALSTITIILTDVNGNKYSSDLLNQSSGTDFEIVSVEDYKDNELSEKTKKVKIRFNCRVTNGTSSIDITNGEAVIAVAYHL